MNRQTGKVRQENKLLTRSGELGLDIEWLGPGVCVNCESRHDIPKGAVLIRNFEQGNGEQPLFMIYAGGLYSALRAQGMHIQNGYDDEQKHLFFVRRMLDLMLEVAHDMPAKDDDQMESYQQNMFELVDSLKGVRNEYKKEAKLRIAKSLNPIDSQGRRNWPSRWMLIWSSNDQIGYRSGEAGEIRQAIDDRKWILVRHLEEIWGMQNSVLSKIDALFEMSDGYQLTMGSMHKVAQEFHLLAEKMGNIHVAPFGSGAFPRCVSDLRKAAMELENHGWTSDAYWFLDRTRRALRLLQTARRLERGLAVVSVALRTGHQWNLLDLEQFQNMLDWMIETFESNDLDEAFDEPMLDKVVKDLKVARRGSQDLITLDLEMVYTSLKTATGRF